MAAAEIKFDAEKVRDYFNRVAIGVKGVNDKDREYVDSIAIFVLKDVWDHFEKQQGSSGKWKAWSKSYRDSLAGVVAFRRIKGRTVPIDPSNWKDFKPRKNRLGGMILQDNGRLKGAFIKSNWRTKSEGVQFFNRAKTKSGFPYAAAHNEGGGKLPKRDFMWLSDTALGRIAIVTMEYIMSRKRKK